MRLKAPNANEPYGRTVLSESGDAHELIVMRWRAGAVCAPHDHGAAVGTIHIVEGHFIERRYQLEDGVLNVVSTSTFSAPALLHVRSEVVHDMESVDGGVTLHRYTPHIRGMCVWDQSSKQVLVVSDECGAWVPADESLILSRSPWSPPV